MFLPGESCGSQHLSETLTFTTVNEEIKKWPKCSGNIAEGRAERPGGEEEGCAMLSSRLYMAVALQSSHQLCSLTQDLHRTKPVSITGGGGTHSELQSYGQPRATKGGRITLPWKQLVDCPRLSGSPTPMPIWAAVIGLSGLLI